MNGNKDTSQKMKTILITGANGFLGSNLTTLLIKNYNVIALVRKTNNSYRLKNIATGLKIYSTREHNLEKVFQENSIDIILHTATVYGRNEEPLEDMLSTNLLLPLNLLHLGMKYNIEVFINADTVLNSNVNPYALSKSQFREWLKLKSDKVKSINIQLEHFYGPGGSLDNFISWVILKLLNNEPELDLTQGEQKRDFLYIDDAVSAYSTIISNLDLLKDNYTTIQVSSGETISIKDLVLLLKKLTGSNTSLNFGALPYRPNELMMPDTNSDLIRSLGWSPKVDIRVGMKRTIEFIKNKA